MAENYLGNGQPQLGSSSGDTSAVYQQAPCPQGSGSHHGHGQRPGTPRARGFLRAETPVYQQAPRECSGQVHTMLDGMTAVQAVPILDDGTQVPIAFMIPTPTP